MRNNQQLTDSLRNNFASLRTKSPRGQDPSIQNLSFKNGLIHYCDSKLRSTENPRQLTGNSQRQIKALVSGCLLSRLNLSECLYVLEKIMEIVRDQGQFLQDPEIVLANFCLDSGGKINVKKTKRSKTQSSIPVKTKNEVIWVRNLMERMSQLFAQCFHDFYVYYKRNQAKQECSLRYFHCLIKSYSLCAKIPISDGINLDRINAAEASNLRMKVMSQKKESEEGEGTKYNNIQRSTSRNCNSENRVVMDRLKKVSKVLPFNKKLFQCVKQQRNKMILPQLCLSFEKQRKGEGKVSLTTNFTTSNEEMSLETPSSTPKGLPNKNLFASQPATKVKTQNADYQKELPFHFYYRNLEEIQSEEENEDNGRVFYSCRGEKNVEIQQNKADNIISSNNWRKRIVSLLNDETGQLKKSYTEGGQKWQSHSPFAHKLNKLAKRVKNSITASTQFGSK